MAGDGWSRDEVKLLLIENLEAVRERMAALLGGIPGVELGFASGVQEARAQCESWSPDVVVLDVQYPDGSGLDFLKYSECCCPHVQLIFFSNQMFYKRRCLTSGATCFLDKSMELDRLVRVLTDMAKREESYATNE